MKKRKPITLQGQQGTSERSFKARSRNCEKLIKRLSVLMADAYSDFEKTPKNWGHAGSMANVEDYLKSAVNFLSEEDDVVVDE